MPPEMKDIEPGWEGYYMVGSGWTASVCKG